MTENQNITSRLTVMGTTLFLTYMSVALAMPVVPMFVMGNLHFTNAVGGLAVGIAFFSTIFSRQYAGYYSDTISSRKCTILGIALYVTAAATCLLSAAPFFYKSWALAILMIGRLILGVGESMTLIGLTSWHFSLIGPQHSGKVMAIAGMAMYGAFAIGGPLGVLLYRHFDFSFTMMLSLVFPMIGYFMLRHLPETKVDDKAQGSSHPFLVILAKIWKQGTVVGLQGVGFAVLGAFVTIYFKSRHWPYAEYGLGLFGLGFVISRICFGGLPDKVGGMKVALFSMSTETAGQSLLWLSGNVYAALLGALLTGLGCSMVFPSMGVEIVKNVEPHERGTAFGAFTAFQDVAYAFSAPIGGVLADYDGYTSVFLLGFLCAAAGIFMIGILHVQKGTSLV